MSNYSRGANFERKLKSLLEKQGYLVVRSAGSRGIFDLWAFDGENLLLIQCKLDGKVTQLEKEAMKLYTKYKRVVPLIAIRKERVGIILKKLDGTLYAVATNKKINLY